MIAAFYIGQQKPVRTLDFVRHIGYDIYAHRFIFNRYAGGIRFHQRRFMLFYYVAVNFLAGHYRFG